MEEQKELRKEFEGLCKPLVDFLYKHGNPHSTIMITQASAELANGELGVSFEIRD